MMFQSVEEMLPEPSRTMASWVGVDDSTARALIVRQAVSPLSRDGILHIHVTGS
jgi:hypothetical protein